MNAPVKIFIIHLWLVVTMIVSTSNAYGRIVYDPVGGGGITCFEITPGQAGLLETGPHRAFTDRAIIPDGAQRTAGDPFLRGRSATKISKIDIVNAHCGLDNGVVIILPVMAGITYSIDGITYQSGNKFEDLKAGTYTAYLKDNDGNIDSSVVQIIGYPELRIIDVAVSPDTCGLGVGSIVISAAGGAGFHSYFLNGAMYMSGAFTGLRPGSYLVYVVDSMLCNQIVTAVIEEVKAPDIDSVSIRYNCDNTANVTVHHKARPGILYRIDQGTAGTDNTLKNIGFGPHHILIETAGGCNAAYSLVIEPDTVVSPVIDVSPAVCGQSNGSLTVSHAGSCSLDGVISADCVYSGLSPGIHTLVYADAKGCSHALSVQVSSDCGIYIPNAFSPNEDGNNDVFNVYYDPGQYAITAFDVFNRWGGKVYSCSGEACGWDGNSNGQTVNPGVYIYKIVLVDKTSLEITEKTGNLVLLR